MKKCLVVILITLLFTSTAYAETMYLKDQAWSYSKNSLIPDNAYFVYGEAEKVNVIGLELVRKTTWAPTKKLYRYLNEYHKVCLVKKNDQVGYIPRNMLTTKKPKYTYTVKQCNKELLISSGAYVYEQPYKKSTKIKLNKQTSLATIGQTNKWYQIYYDGSVYFIRKDSRDIINIDFVDYPNIILSGVGDNCKIRFKYYYNMMPKEIRDKLDCFTFVISDWNNINPVYSALLANIEKTAGFMAYQDRVIYLKNIDDVNLEYALFHEIGHVLYLENKPSVYYLDERKNLKLFERYMDIGEYYAEGFDLYMRQYDMLQESAPKLFEYYDDIVNW